MFGLARHLETGIWHGLPSGASGGTLPFTENHKLLKIRTASKSSAGEHVEFLKAFYGCSVNLCNFYA